MKDSKSTRCECRLLEKTFSLNALVRKMRSRPNGKNWRCIPNQGLMGSAPLTMLEYADSPSPLIARTRYAKRSPFLRLESLYSVAVAGSFAIRLQVPFALRSFSVRRSTTPPVGFPPCTSHPSFTVLPVKERVSELGASGRTGQSK